MGNFHIVVADDHTLFRQGLKRLIECVTDLMVVGEAGDGLDLLRLLKSKSVVPDLVILDISMPHLRGIEAIPEIRALLPEVKILIVTIHQDPEYLYQALAAGVNGYFLKKDADTELFAAIDKIRKGRIYVSPHLSENIEQGWEQIRKGLSKAVLTARETDVLKLIAAGKANKEIADTLFISVHTVERHRANMMQKLSLKNTAELVRYAVRKGYIR